MPRTAEPYEAYLFVYFTGEGPGGEAIRLAVTRGNDPLRDWVELGDGAPILTSTVGERGVRDPHILRHPDGDRYFIIATDLRIHGGNDFGRAQEQGSTSMVVWESPDLVSWSEPRLTPVMGPEAGNVWAPEAVWDADRGEFFVFWASALYPTADRSARSIRDSYQRMFHSTTQDFISFTPPVLWQDERRGPGLGLIDSTIVEQDGIHYRFTKDEACMLPRLDRSDDLHSLSWERLAERVGEGQPNPWGGTFTEGEGPTAFRANDGDGWFLFIDQPAYHGGEGYLPFHTDDLASGSFTSVDAQLPRSPRHGTVLPITAAERDRLLAAFPGRFA